jgi:hypothetical protein
MKHTVVLNQAKNNWDSEDRTLILGFLEYCFSELYITNPVTIKLENDSSENIDIGVKLNLRLAFVNLDDRLVIIYCKNRGLLDVLRSVAHELIHVQQLDLGLLSTTTHIDFYLPTHESPGYEFEYEAYGLSGIMVRNYRAVLNGNASNE